MARWYDCDDLPPLDSRREAYGRVLGGEFATSAGKPHLSVTVPVTTTLGRSALDFEGGARHLAPVAIWWLNGRDIRWQEAVLLLDPGSSSCTIVCPAILRCDESHGVERIVYDPATRRVFGDGCRLRPFVLTEDLSEIEAWLSSGR